MEVLQAIRCSTAITILIVRARVEPESVSKAMELGADDYIVKPFDYKDLLARLDNAMHRHHKC